MKAIAASYGESAVFALAEIATDKAQPAAARVSAANALLDRGFGKPAQTLQGPNGQPLIPSKPADMTDEQLAAIAAGGGPTAA